MTCMYVLMLYCAVVLQEFWDREKSKVISKPQASDSTLFEWCPDGVHFVTATTSPRLREGNG